MPQNSPPPTGNPVVAGLPTSPDRATDPTDTDGPVLEQWNAVHRQLTDAGLSNLPLPAGAGVAGGGTYAWGGVGCISQRGSTIYVGGSRIPVVGPEH
jgi:hypothetical protein